MSITHHHAVLYSFSGCANNRFYTAIKIRQSAEISFICFFLLRICFPVHATRSTYCRLYSWYLLNMIAHFHRPYKVHRPLAELGSRNRGSKAAERAEKPRMCVLERRELKSLNLPRLSLCFLEKSEAFKVLGVFFFLQTGELSPPKRVTLRLLMGKKGKRRSNNPKLLFPKCAGIHKCTLIYWLMCVSQTIYHHLFYSGS